MIRAKHILVILLALLSLGISAQAQRKTRQTQVIDRGKFRFYETKEIRGEEDFTISRGKNDELFVEAKISLPFAEQDLKPKVWATLRTKADDTPRTFQIKGPTLLEIQENTSIQINGQTANIKDLGRNKTLKLSAPFFTLSGYVPLTMEMMLVRYWISHGKPASIQLLPT